LSDFEQNRAFWDRHSDDYQETHREHIGRPEPRWGMWQLPESELEILGDVAGKDVLELGCGAAQWSILLAGLGARPVGVDNSERQLEHARDALAARASISPSSTPPPRTSRSPTRASTSFSPTTARTASPTRSPGCPRRRVY
jgi:SAM-dependent methyltransferase